MSMAKCGVKRKTREAPPLDDLDAWNSSPRLQRHAQRLLCNPNLMGVLQRYKDKAHTQGSDELQRFLVHVSAWVALLPADSELLPACVELLSGLLKLRGRFKLSPWLLGSLRLVGHRMFAGIQGNLPGSASFDWKILKKQMPKRALDLPGSCQSVEQLELNGNSYKSEPDKPENSVEVLQKAISRWQMASEAKRQEILAALRIKCKMQPSGDVQRDRLILFSVFKDLVAAMSPPLHISQRQGDERGSGNIKADQPVSDAVSQRDVRMLLIQLLPKLNLDDPLFQSSLFRLKTLISDFESRNNTLVQHAAQGAQWAEIRDLLDHSPKQDSDVRMRWTDEEKKEFRCFMEARAADGTPSSADFKAAAERFKRTYYAVKAFYRSYADPRYCPAQPADKRHKKGLIKEIVVKGMRDLGGNATLPELISFIDNDPDIQKTYGHRLKKSLTKIHGSMSLIPAWERTVRTNAVKLLQITSNKREGRTIYQLKPESKG